MHFDVTRGLLYIFLQPFLYQSQGSSHNRNCCSFHPPLSFNFDFKVFIFSQFFSYFIWSVLFSGYGHINKQAAFFPFVLDYNVWSVGLYLSIRLYWHISQDCDIVFGADARIISRLCLYSSLWKCSSADMWRLCCVCVSIQFWPAQGTLPQYGQ